MCFGNGSFSSATEIQAPLFPGVKEHRYSGDCEDVKRLSVQKIGKKRWNTLQKGGCTTLLQRGSHGLWGVSRIVAAHKEDGFGGTGHHTSPVTDAVLRTDDFRHSALNLQHVGSQFLAERNTVGATHATNRMDFGDVPLDEGPSESVGQLGLNFHVLHHSTPRESILSIVVQNSFFVNTRYSPCGSTRNATRYLALRRHLRKFRWGDELRSRRGLARR